MNSYLRQTTPIPADQMHNFLRDKQAWENAIAMYQGPDPLDHWYNYVCWYENHGHGDPENKFRETLERCLALYEHSDYYNQDARMVRLWLKYIDMQTNPLHFYQVLYQRGVGRQVSAFYISWAGFYESTHLFKEAESVYNLGFQEKAQSYAELHHAHSKMIYTRAAAEETQQAAQQKATVQLQQQMQQQQLQQIQEQLQQQQVCYQQQQQQQQQQGVHLQTHQAQLSVVSSVSVGIVASGQVQMHAAQVQSYRQSEAYQLPVAQQQQQQQQQQLYQQPSGYQQHQLQQEQLQQQQLQQQQQQLEQQRQQQNLDNASTAAGAVAVAVAVPAPNGTAYVTPASAAQQHIHQHHQQTLQQRSAAMIHDAPVPPIEQQLPAANATATASAYQQHQQQLLQQQQKHEAMSRNNNNHKSSTPSSKSSKSSSGRVSGIRLPRKFASHCRNNFETWKPALFLEEPSDPCRVCHYAKELVYPPGAGVEYSPEELRARSYTARRAAAQVVWKEEVLEEEEEETSPPPSPPPPQQQAVAQRQPDYYGSEQYPYQTAQPTDPNEYGAQASAAAAAPPADNEEDGEEEEEEDTADDTAEDTAEETAEETADESAEESADDTAEDTAEETEDDAQQPQHEEMSYNHTDDDLEEQIEASTIRFSENKTIKIKFKKERTQSGTALNGGNYSAYTIENVYQQQKRKHKHHEETLSPINAASSARSRNGHTFHPYMLAQTSTPKTASKRTKSKLKRVNKFQPPPSNSSSSSTAENGVATANGSATAPPDARAMISYNDNANYSFSSAVAHDNSNCSLTSAVGRLNFRDAVNSGGLHHQHNNSTLTSAANATATLTTSTTTVADFSTYQENSYFATQHDTEAKERRRRKALETIERHLAREAIDPFSSELCRAFLTKLDFPGAADEGHANYKIIQTPLPKIANTRTLALPDGVHFSIDKEVGRGSYGSVYKASDVNTGAVVALKFQKPPNTWEIYICDQVLKRIRTPSVLPGLMDISTAIIAPNASLIATEFSPFGSLLDINNKIRQSTTKVMHESLVMHFSAQICNIIHHLHCNRIIHADIKPDNFLLMRIPNTDLHIPSLRLIDFGCAIDMSLFPNGDRTKFRKVIQTDGFTCIEMQEGRPWSYETDLFCIAGTVHVMLLGEYMQLQKRAGSWDIKQKLPRYLKKHVWTSFYNDMLNVRDASRLPNLAEQRAIFNEEAAKMDSELQKQIRTLSNILHRR